MRVAGLLAILAVAGGIAARQWDTVASPTATVPARVHHRERPGSPGAPEGLPATAGDPRGARAEADGAIPEGTTLFDEGIPGVAKLEPRLLHALRQAATDASREGVAFDVDSGWRSPAYQEQLFRQAVAKYGSAAAAARWVAPPDRSAHVSGDAIDLASAAAAWLRAHGAAYGLCQIYGNEPWHFELRPQAVTHGCPAMYADPTYDPRMRT